MSNLKRSGLIERWRRTFRVPRAEAAAAIGSLGEPDDPQTERISKVRRAFGLTESEAKLFVELGEMRLKRAGMQ